MSPKKFWVPKKSWVQQNFWSKNFRSKKVLGPRKFWVQIMSNECVQWFRNQFKIIMILTNSALTSISTCLKAEVALFSILLRHPSTQPPTKFFNQFLNLQIYWMIKQLKYLYKNFDLALKKRKFLSIRSQITIFKQLETNLFIKHIFGPKNNLFGRFFYQHCNWSPTTEEA